MDRAYSNVTTPFIFHCEDDWEFYRKGFIEDVEILTGQPEIEDVHTVSLYIGSSRQVEYYDYIISLRPKRVIFNPGTENLELQKLA